MTPEEVGDVVFGRWTRDAPPPDRVGQATYTVQAYWPRYPEWQTVVEEHLGHIYEDLPDVLPIVNEYDMALAYVTLATE